MEQVLIQKAVGGDREALEKLIETHHEQLQYALAGRIPSRWRSVLGVNDVLQETYVDAYISIRTFVPRGEGAFRGWLLAIAKNNLRNAIESLETEKRGGRRKRVATGENGYAHLYELVVGSSTPGREVARAEATKMLRDALQQLPEHYSRVIQMYDLDGLSMSDVATTIGKSEGAAFMIRQRALGVLHRFLLDPLADYSSFS